MKKQQKHLALHGEITMENKKDIPYIVFELTVDKLTTVIKRLWIALILLIFLLVGTNIAWIYYESQFEEVSFEQEVQQEADGEGNNSFIGGNYYGETDSKDNH